MLQDIGVMNKNTNQIQHSSILPAIERLWERLQYTASAGDALGGFDLEGFKVAKHHNVTFEQKLACGDMVWNFHVIETTKGKFLIQSAARLTPTFDKRDKFEVLLTLFDEHGEPNRTANWFSEIRGFLYELKGWAVNGEVVGRHIQTTHS